MHLSLKLLPMSSYVSSDIKQKLNNTCIIIWVQIKRNVRYTKYWMIQPLPYQYVPYFLIYIGWISRAAFSIMAKNSIKFVAYNESSLMSWWFISLHFSICFEPIRWFLNLWRQDSSVSTCGHLDLSNKRWIML